MSKPEKNEAFSMDTHFDDAFELDIPAPEEPQELFQMDTSVSEDTDDFFQEFNKPTQQPAKKTKQELLHEFQKINTKMNPELHKKLKIYCSLNDIKKNTAFQEAMEEYLAKNEEKTVDFSNEINGTQIELDMPSNLKKSFNFEVRKSFFKELKTFSITHDLKLAELYEQAIIDYLHTRRFNL